MWAHLPKKLHQLPVNIHGAFPIRARTGWAVQTNNILKAQSNLHFLQTLLSETQNQANEISQEIEQRQRNKDEILWLTWLLASRGTNTLKVFLESLLTTDNLMVFHLLWRNSTKNSSYLFQKNTNKQLRIFKIVLNVALVNQSFAVCFLGFFLVLFWLLSTFFFYLLFSVFIAAKFVLSGTGLQTP